MYLICRVFFVAHPPACHRCSHIWHIIFIFSAPTCIIPIVFYVVRFILSAFVIFCLHSWPLRSRSFVFAYLSFCHVAVIRLMPYVVYLAVECVYVCIMKNALELPHTIWLILKLCEAGWRRTERTESLQYYASIFQISDEICSEIIFIRTKNLVSSGRNTTHKRRCD